MTAKSENEIMEDFILKSSRQPEVAIVAMAEARNLLVPQGPAGVAHGLAVGARLLAEVLWPGLTADEMRKQVEAIGEIMILKGLL